MSDPWTVAGLLSTTEEFFSKKGIESARIDAELLLADTLDLTRESLLARRERGITDIELSAYRERVRHRAANKPVAYLLNRREFYSINFYVDASVLIPRPETEILVEQTLKIISSKSQIHICDVGTGSGCVAAALAHSRPDVFVTATELSGSAARLAVRNLSDLGLLKNVRVVQCDIFPADSITSFDLIVSNPPYLSMEEYAALPPGIRRFEPQEALTDSGDGLGVYRRIFKLSAKRLRPEGILLLEISPRIAQILNTGGLDPSPFAPGTVHPDLAGRPRVAEFHLKTN